MIPICETPLPTMLVIAFFLWQVDRLLTSERDPAARRALKWVGAAAWVALAAVVVHWVAAAVAVA